MGLRSRLRVFVFDVMRTLNPKYYRALGRRDLNGSIYYFFKVVAFAFFIMAILAVPKIYFFKEELNQAVLNIATIKLDIDLKTTEPVLIPKNEPFITFDSTGNKSLDSELLLVTDEKLFVNMGNTKGEFNFGEYDFLQDKKTITDAITTILLVLLPCLFIIFYVVYLIKYIIVILPITLVSYFFAKMFGNVIELKQAFTLSFYTATIMILIEILTLPFYLNKYLITHSPLIGVNFSLIAFTAYLTLFVTAIRLNGNKDLR